jgi:hypothetical protein
MTLVGTCQTDGLPDGQHGRERGQILGTPARRIGVGDVSGQQLLPSVEPRQALVGQIEQIRLSPVHGRSCLHAADDRWNSSTPG